MMGSIDKQATIDAIYEKANEERADANHHFLAGVHMAIAVVRDMPERQWIPCSERLPENGRQVLVYARSVHYALAKYDEMREADGTYKKQWVTFDAWKPYYTIKEVIAWMPLPEPAKEDDHDHT